MFLICANKSPKDGGIYQLISNKSYIVIDLDTYKYKEISGSGIIKNIKADEKNGLPCRYINARGAIAFAGVSIEHAKANCTVPKQRLTICADIQGNFRSNYQLPFSFSTKIMNKYMLFIFDESMYLPIEISANNDITEYVENELSIYGTRVFQGATLNIEDIYSYNISDYASLVVQFNEVEYNKNSVEFFLSLQSAQARGTQTIDVGRFKITKTTLNCNGVTTKLPSLSDVAKRLLSNYSLPNICAFSKYSCLSNYFSCPVYYDGRNYKSSEAAYQSMKTLDVDLRNEFSSLTPDEAKSLGRKIQDSSELRKDWSYIQYDIMRNIVMAKMQQNNEIAQVLLNTGNLMLLEDTTGWHDNIWGHCSCPKCVNASYKNYLGNILVEVRTMLRE